MVLIDVQLPNVEAYLKAKGLEGTLIADRTRCHPAPGDVVITEPRFLPHWRSVLPDGISLLVLPSLVEDSPLLRAAPPQKPNYPAPPVEEIRELLRTARYVGLDVETETASSKPNEIWDTLLGVGISVDGKTFFGTPEHTDYMALLRELPPVYAWNGKYDLGVLRRYGVHLRLRGDGCIAAYLLGEPDASLKKRVQAHFGVTLPTLQQVTGGLPTSLRDLSLYCMNDAYWAVEMSRALEEEIEQRGLGEAYRLDLALVEILLSMQERGIGFDRRKAAERLRQCKQKLRALEREIRSLAEADGFRLPPIVKRCPLCRGGKKKRLSCERCLGSGKRSIPQHLNPSSVSQVRTWLLDSGRISPSRLTPGGEVQLAALDLLRHREDPACLLLLEHRALTKEISFLKQWSSYARQSVIHTHLTNTRVVSGRLSSREPNLQQVKAEWRDLFCPNKFHLRRSDAMESHHTVSSLPGPSRVRPRLSEGEGDVPDTSGHPEIAFVAGDYNQLEVRVMAAVSGDPAMVETLCRDPNGPGGNLHARTTSALFGVPVEDAKKDLRLYTAGKSVNFAVGYGATEGKVRELIEAQALRNPSLGLSVPSREEAKQWLLAHRATYSRYWEWAEDELSRCRSRGYSLTLFGHRRELYNLHSSDPSLRMEAERQAINHVIQGSAAWIVKLAMQRAWETGLDLRLQIHDEILIVSEDPEQDAARLRACMEMEKLIPHVPLRVDVSWGRTWLDAHK